MESFRCKNSFASIFSCLDSNLVVASSTQHGKKVLVSDRPFIEQYRQQEQKKDFLRLPHKGLANIWMANNHLNLFTPIEDEIEIFDRLFHL